jgi:8-oxo-dGTP pyrophosphatase MutT (NUDIX family)
MKEEEKYRQEHPKRDVAVVGIRDVLGNVLLVRTHKLTEYWQLIGGGIDPEDKTPQNAATREIQEELGIKVSPADLRPIIDVPYDFGEGTVYFYELEINRKTTRFEIDKGEIIDHQWFSSQEARQLKAFPATQTYLQTLDQR